MTARLMSAKPTYDRMPKGGAVLEIREVSGSDSACEPTKESEKECFPKARGKPPLG